MHNSILSLVKNKLACPYCKNILQHAGSAFYCNNCDNSFPCMSCNQIDLRLKQPMLYDYQFELGTLLNFDVDFTFDLPKMNSTANVDFTGIKVPYHLTTELLSFFPKADNNNSIVLDLGCGNMVHKSVCEIAGYNHVGLDYSSHEAPILGDAHALPFIDNSFEFVLSIAVFEHLRFPFVAIKEVSRVLKSHGTFIGSIAFLEPFHGDSFYHHTHLGIYNLLREGNFEVETIFPNENWSALKALATMSLFPKMPKVCSKAIVMPLQIVHRIWWKFGFMFSKKATNKTRLIGNSGSFSFIAHKK